MNIKGFQKLSIVQKMALFVLFVVVVSVCLILFLIRPVMANVQEIKDDINNQRVELEEKYLRGLNAKMISRNLDKIESNLEFLDQIFIKEDGYLDLVTSLEGLAEKKGLEERLDILKNRSTDRGFYEIVPVHVEVRGNFDNLLAFLVELKGKDYQFNINSLRIRSQDPASTEDLRRNYFDQEEGPEEYSEEVLDEEFVDGPEVQGPEVGEEEVLDITNEETDLGEFNNLYDPGPIDKDFSMLILGEVYWKNQ